MKQFILLITLAVLVNVVVGRAVSGKKEKNEHEQNHEQQNSEDVAVSVANKIIIIAKNGKSIIEKMHLKYSLHIILITHKQAMM